MRLATLALLLALLLTACPHPDPRSTPPQTYYVSPAGANSHSCATAKAGGTSAKRTLNGPDGGMACLAAGDTLVLQDGVYDEQVSDSDDREHPGATRPPAGFAERYTTIKAEHPRGATLQKPHPGDPYNHVVMLGRTDTQYIRLQGLVLDGRGHGACVWLGPGSHLTLEGSLVRNCGGNGVYVSVDESGGGGVDIQLVRNTITNVAMEQTGFPGAHAVYFVGSYGLLRANHILAPCPFYGLHLSSEKGGLHHNTIERNRVEGCGQAGILNQGAQTVTRNNLLLGNGIGIQCNGSGDQVVANNTIYGWWQSPSNGDDSYGILDLTGSPGCEVINNVILKQRDVSSVARYYYNTTGQYRGSHNLCDGVNQQHCQQYVTDAQTVLVDPDKGDLRLKEGSPALDQGTPRGDVPTDRLGTPRPVAAAYDVGAFEGVTAPVPIPPDPPIPPEPGPQPPAGGALACTGAVAAVPGVLTMSCVPQEGRR